MVIKGSEDNRGQKDQEFRQGHRLSRALSADWEQQKNLQRARAGNQAWHLLAAPESQTHLALGGPL